MKAKLKKHYWKIIGFTSLFAASLVSAITVPLVMESKKQYYLNSNHSADTLEGNKSRINYYIDNYLYPNRYNLSGSLKVYGNGVIGTKGVELSSNERSLITIQDANDNNLFQLVLSSSINYQMRQNQIHYSLAYVKPSYGDSSSPVVGIKLFYGSGSNYYETIFEYNDSNLYGFKISLEQSMLEQYISDITENPLNYFQLKKEVGVIGETGLYAKNIKVEDFDLNTDLLKKLREKNYWLNISSVAPDAYNPSLLKINYNIIYNNGSTSSSSASKILYLGTFDIEQGVDDPESKLNNFIQKNTDWINNLNQYFEYNPPVIKSQEDGTTAPDTPLMSIRDAYQSGYIALKTNYSIDSKLETDGIKMEFKLYNDEDPKNLSAFNYEFDSTTPTYRIYFTSYPDTPLAFTKSVLIEGLAQENDFIKSTEEKQMNAFVNYLYENNLGLEDIFDLDTSGNNPLSLSDYFMKNNGVSFSNNKYSIPFEFVYSLYEKYKAQLIKNPNDQPFTNFKYVLKKTDLPTTNYTYEGETFNINEIANNILNCINNTANGGVEVQLDSLSNTFQSKSLKLNIFLGDAAQGTIYTNIEPLEIYIANYFENEEIYYQKILDSMTITKDNVLIKSKIVNKELLKQKIRERNWSEIFESANLYNVTTNMPFSELMPELKVGINMAYFETYDSTKIEQTIQQESFDIQISITLGNVTVNKLITKSFQDLQAA